MNFNEDELELIVDGLGWLLDQTNDNGISPYWQNAEKLRDKIRKELE